MNATDLYGQRISRVLYGMDAGAQYAFLNSLVRSVLQTAAMCLIEYCYASADDIEGSLLPESAANMLSPADGDSVRGLSGLIPLARDSGWPGCSSGWFTPHKGGQDSLRKRTEAWVKHRNDHPGHGVVAANIVDGAMAWLPGLAQDLVQGLSDLLPEVEEDGALALRRPSGDPLKISVLRFDKHSPIVIRSIQLRGQAFRVQYQTLDPEVSRESFFELPPGSPMETLCRTETKRYRQVKLSLPDEPSSWDLYVCLPSRQTAAFTGRSHEIERLQEWLDDTDSRVCNVYGEGGIGKTTLVLEVLNAILTQEFKAPTWRPEIICFFSAKETRWGPDGLQVLKGVASTVEDAAREVARSYEEPLTRSWYDGEPRTIIDRAATLMNGLGCERNKILLVLDNSETLARSAAEEEELGKLIAYMGKRLCRVLVTSRRRERLEAHPLLVPPMEEDVAVALLRRLGKEYGANPLLQAGESTLRKISRQFGGRPLLLDACARLVGRFAYSIDRGVESVMQMAAGDLGAFLYEDAWTRMSSDVRDSLLVLGQIGGTVTGEVVGWTCAEMHVAHADLLQALDETRFGALLDYGQHYDVNLDPSARAFLGQKFAAATPEVRLRVEKAASHIRRKNEQWLNANHSIVNDRVERAFASEAAKAAHKAARSGDHEEALRWFEEAVQSDRGNAALLDRFAWYLAMERRDFVRAAGIAKLACDAGPRDADAHFTAGLIAARIGDVTSADRLLTQAVLLGKPEHLSAIQRAWSRCSKIKKVFDQDPVDLAEIDRLSAEARGLADNGVLRNPVTPMELKHMDEVERIRRRLNDFRVRAEKLRLMRRGTGKRPGP